MLNKVALITGSKEGIGFHTALQLAFKNWTVLLADKQDLLETKNNIIKKTSNPHVFAYNLDLENFKTVRKFAQEVKLTHGHLNVLINNAGIYESNVEKTIDNLNPVIQVNHLGPFLLTLLLTDLIKKSSPSRIIFLASSGAFLHTLDDKKLPDFQSTQYFSNIVGPTLAYYNSKLCNMIIAKEFSDKLKGFKITSNCLHPGMTNSNFLLKGSSIKYLSPVAHRILHFFTQDVEISAQAVTFLATSNSLSQVTGQYFVNYQISQMPKIVDNIEFRKRIWLQAEESVNLLKTEKQLLHK